MQISEELEFLTRIVKESSKKISDFFEVNPKDDKGDLVTNCDYAVEQYLINEIQKSYPGFTIISEEYNSTNQVTDNCFVVDPIDGTINFAHHLPLWGIQVACVRNGKPCASVIYLPKLNEFYSADENGTYLNNEPISVNKLDAQSIICDIEGPNKYNLQAEAIKKFRHVRNINSAAVVFAWVASGRLGAATYVGWDKAWDYLPGQYLVEKAGGVIYNSTNIHLAANTPETLAILLGAVKLPQD